jgi:transcriptional regulator with XRE-family HTH domain
MPTFTVEQAIAPRSFLGWSQHELGAVSGLSFETARNYERDEQSATAKSITAISNGISQRWRRFSKARQACWRNRASIGIE